MSVTRGTKTFVDDFDRAQAFTTTPGMNGWTIKDTSSSGTPTYLCASEDGGKAVLSFDSQSEAQSIVLYQNDLLNYDLAKLQKVWWVLKVVAFSAVTDMCWGVAAATNATMNTVATNAWFMMDGSDSQSAVVVETDDAVTDNDDVATGVTQAAVYKKYEIDFAQGLADVRFYADGARVAASTTFDMSGLTSGLNVQPYLNILKASGTTVDAVHIAQFGIQYSYAYGA